MKIFVTILLSVFCIFAQSPAEMKSAGDAERAAREAYEAKSYAEYLTEMQKANIARPNHPRIIYNLASAFSLNGQDGNALQALDRLARMGLAYDLGKDEDFKSLRGYLKYKDLQKWLATNRTVSGGSVKAFEIDDKELIAEGVAYDPKTGTFYVSSVHKRKIVAVSKDGIVRGFSKESDGLWGVFGIRADSERGHLWVTTMAAPAMFGFNESENGRSGIFRYDLKTGKLLKKYILPAGERHALGDLIIVPDGRVFTTDSASPVIYIIDPKKDELEELVRSDDFVSLQGLTTGLNDRTLYVADYSKGIFRIDIQTKQITQLIPESDVTVLGIDGLYLSGSVSGFIAIQNGISPSRVVAFSFSGDRIYMSKTLEAGHPDFLEPTLGVLDGDNFYYIANSQWPLVNEKGELAQDKLRHPVILKLDARKARAK